MLSQPPAWGKHTGISALCWGILKAGLAWGSSPGLVFELSCQSREGLSADSRRNTGRSSVPGHREIFSSSVLAELCQAQGSEMAQGTWAGGRHPLRAAQPRGVSQSCSGTRRPCPGNASPASSLMASPSTGHREAAARAAAFCRGQKELLGTFWGTPTALPVPGASQHWPGHSTGAAPGPRRVGCPAALTLGGFLHPWSGEGSEPWLEHSTHPA